MIKNRIFIYAFNKTFDILAYHYLDRDRADIAHMAFTVDQMRDNPDVVEIVAVDNRLGLYQEYMEATKSKNFADRFVFKSGLEDEGLILFQR